MYGTQGAVYLLFPFFTNYFCPEAHLYFYMDVPGGHKGVCTCVCMRVCVCVYACTYGCVMNAFGFDTLCDMDTSSLVL